MILLGLESPSAAPISTTAASTSSTPPTPTQSTSIQSANSAFTSLVYAALQHITQGILTHNAELISQGRTEINTALLNYNTALATCIGGAAASSTATTP